MKKKVKLFKYIFTPILLVIMLLSLTVGVLREVKYTKEVKNIYFEYTCEGSDYLWKESEGKLYLITMSGEFECSVEEGVISVEVDGAKIEAIAAEDGSVIKLPVDEGSVPPGAEITYYDFIKSGKEVISEKEIVPSNYVMEALGLDQLEEAMGKHYFNSIFCSLSSTSFTLLLLIAIKRNKRIKNKKKKVSELNSESVKVKIPQPSNQNPTQGQHNLKF